MKKTTKTILALGLCFTFFYNCSNDDAFSEEIEGATITETIQAPITGTTQTTTADTSKTTIQENLADVKTYHPSEQAGKTLDWFNGGDNTVEEGTVTTPTMNLIVEFRDGITATEKTDARARYTAYLGLLSYVTCGGSQTNKEIWTLDQTIYEDDTIPPPATDPNIGPDPTGATKDSTVKLDPDFNRVDVSTSNSPCSE